MEREDHDQRIKTLIKAYFLEFMQLFFREWTELLDCRDPEWIEQEAFPEPPAGPRRLMDLVAKVPTRKAIPNALDQQAVLAVVHIEIESQDSVGDIPQRMFHYDNALEDRYGLTTLPIVLFLNLGLEGLGELSYVRYCGPLEKMRFRFFYIGLKALDGLQYLQGDNLLGVALGALMRIPRESIANFGAEALRRFLVTPLPELRRNMLTECVEAYLPMGEEQRLQFAEIIKAQPYEGVRAMNLTTFEKGKLSERLEGLREQLAEKFGPLSAAIEAKLANLSWDDSLALRKRILKATSLAELGLDD